MSELKKSPYKRTHDHLCKHCGKPIKTTKYGRVCDECNKNGWFKNGK